MKRDPIIDPQPSKGAPSGGVSHPSADRVKSIKGGNPNFTKDTSRSSWPKPNSPY